MEMEAKQGFALSFRSVLFSLSPSIPFCHWLLLYDVAIRLYCPNRVAVRLSLRSSASACASAARRGPLEPLESGVSRRRGPWPSRIGVGTAGSPLH